MCEGRGGERRRGCNPIFRGCPCITQTRVLEYPAREYRVVPGPTHLCIDLRALHKATFHICRSDSWMPRLNVPFPMPSSPLYGFLPVRRHVGPLAELSLTLQRALLCSPRLPWEDPHPGSQTLPCTLPGLSAFPVTHHRSSPQESLASPCFLEKSLTHLLFIPPISQSVLSSERG